MLKDIAPMVIVYRRDNSLVDNYSLVDAKRALTCPGLFFHDKDVGSHLHLSFLPHTPGSLRGGMQQFPFLFLHLGDLPTRIGLSIPLRSGRQQ